MLKDPDLFVRMATARALGDLKSERAIGPLIDALEDQETSVREAAVVALRVTTGRNFKFDPLASETDRARKVKAWRDWYKKSGLQDEGAPSEGEEPAE
jgi:HEAT repeat protein